VVGTVHEINWLPARTADAIQRIARDSSNPLGPGRRIGLILLAILRPAR